jgi:RNA ligase
MKLNALFDMDLYRQMVLDKYVRVNQHPDLPLSIINYTEKAQFDNEWNEVTRQSRGLIIDDKLNVIARPFDKFLNYGQNPDDVKLMDYPVEVTDKMDGSLGIIFEYQREWYVATRGSFVSDQAIWATDFLRRITNGDVRGYVPIPSPSWTYLVEIIYPGNRVVLNYGDREDLVLLAAREIFTGSVRPAEAVIEWYGPKTTTFPYKTLREAIEAAPRLNAEGYVIYFPTLDYRIKLKQDDYVALHKIVTGLTARRIWENMKEGADLPDLLEIVPDEWHIWLEKTFGDIMSSYHLLRQDILDVYDDIVHSLTITHGPFWTRKEFAVEAMNSPYPGFMFSLLDDKDIDQKVWDLVRPEAE